MLAKPKVEKSEDFLINQGKLMKEKLDQKRSEIMQHELEECKFRPSISKKSEQIMNVKVLGNYPNMNQKPPLTSKFTSLYEDAQRRKER